MKRDVTVAPELVTLIARLADNKLHLGRRYAEWCTGAPTLEAAVAAASMAQDEIGHARSLYPLLQDLAGESEQTQPETRTHFDCVPSLERSFEGWADFVAANFLIDTALSVLLESARASSLEPLGQRARRILEEERLHWLHAEGWTRRLAATTPAMRTALSASMSGATPGCSFILDVAESELVETKVLDAPAPELIHRFRNRVDPVLQSAGLSPL